MADRIFAGLLLLAAIGYTAIAFTVIKAPFQYDPLGPETWPRLVGMLATLCSAYLLVRPDAASLGIAGKTAVRIASLIVLLSAYAALYRPLGFIPSTWLFCTALCLQLGGRLTAAVAFGAIAGVAGYFLCTDLLELNLPAGILSAIL